MELSLKDRLLLANQYAILAKLTDGQEAEGYETARKAVERGYSAFYEYGDLSRNPMTHEDCSQVGKIMDMYFILQRSTEELDHADGIDDDRLPFPGFDGNNETPQYGYASFLVNDLDRYANLVIEDDHLNSHRPMLEQYRRMLDEFEPRRRRTFGTQLLDREDVIAVLDA